MDSAEAMKPLRSHRRVVLAITVGSGALIMLAVFAVEFGQGCIERSWIGRSREDVVRTFGEPSRVSLCDGYRVLFIEKRQRAESGLSGSREIVHLKWFVLDRSDIVIDAGAGVLSPEWAKCLDDPKGVP